jgi:PAS domain S-box-containing protein
LNTSENGYEKGNGISNPVNAALLEQFKLFSSISDSSTDAIRVKDLAGRYLLFNKEAAKVVGKTPADVLGKDDFNIFPAYEAKAIMDADRKVMESGVVSTHEEIVSTVDGQTIYLATKGPIFDCDGKVSGVFVISRDITERKRMNDALRESEALLQAAIKLLPVGLWIINADGMIVTRSAAVTVNQDITERKQAEEELRQNRNMLYKILNTIPQSVFWKDRDSRYLGCNLQFARAVGMENPDKIIGKTDFDLPWPRKEAEVYRADDRFVMDNNLSKPHIIEPLQQADGNRLWIDTTKIPLTDERGSVYGVLGVFDNISERKRLEEMQQLSENRYKMLFDNAPVLIDGFDINGRCILWNKECENVFGWTIDEINSQDEPLALFYPDPEVRKEVMETVTSKPEKVYKEWHPVTKKGNKIITLWANFSFSDGTIINIGYDITLQKQLEVEREKSEQQRNQMQKLESLGVLAGGIAHDFNNLMGGIFGYIDMAIEETKESKVTSYLTKAMNTIDRARALTQQLLTFAKGGAPIQEIGQLFPFVEETAKFALSGSNVSCHFDVPQNLWACNFDKNQISQVIDNLIINAQQAMPVGGAIELTARNITLAEKEHPLLAKGDYVKLSVKDTGVGIPKEHISRIFDPFFTTKTKGHGLGLATCYSIIKRHEGCIDVESVPGKGSTFKVYLPASSGPVSVTSNKKDKTHKGSGTFLVMDDEEVMRDTLKNMLESLGYSVVSKENGKDAIDFFASEIKTNRKIVGMIFDLTVPGGMGGKAAIEEIRKTNTEIPAFVASGYADDPVIKNPSEHGFTASICKPFIKSEISGMLNKYMKQKK